MTKRVRPWTFGLTLIDKIAGIVTIRIIYIHFGRIEVDKDIPAKYLSATISIDSLNMHL